MVSRRRKEKKDLDNITVVEVFQEPRKCIWCPRLGSCLARHGRYRAVAVCRRFFDSPGFTERIRTIHQLPRGEMYLDTISVSDLTCILVEDQDLATFGVERKPFP